MALKLWYSKDAKEKYRIISSYEKEEDERFVSSKVMILSVCALTTAVLSVFNLIDKSWAMLTVTLILTGGLLISVCIEKFFKLYFAGDILAASSSAIAFSYFALIGGNDGFAILWFLVLPTIIMTLNKKVGMGLSVYSLIFIIIICYIPPIRNMISGYYSSTFLTRFPLLYVTNFLIALYTYLNSVYSEITLSIKTYVDELSGLFNRQFYNVICNHINVNNLTNKVTFVSLDVNGLKMVNDEQGHVAGDKLIETTSRIVEEAFNINNSLGIFRIGGDEFVAILRCDRSDIPTFERRLIETQKSYSEKTQMTISISYGFACGMDYPNETTEGLYKIADEMMLTNKTSYYVTHKIERRHSERRVLNRRVTDIMNKDDNE